jgi:DNA-binding MarR family transcriptional regulator
MYAAGCDVRRWSGRKRYFAAIPLRALADSRLKRAHLIVLAVVAAHDRFGENGFGCTLSTRRIAEILNSIQPTVSNACQELIAWGYLDRATNPAHIQKRMLSIVYESDADRAAMKWRTDVRKRIGSPTHPGRAGDQANPFIPERP